MGNSISSAIGGSILPQGIVRYQPKIMKGEKEWTRGDGGIGVLKFQVGHHSFFHEKKMEWSSTTIENDTSSNL